jgi:predicted amidohydrolase YtcJ
MGRTLFRNGTVWAGDPPTRSASWLLVEDGTIAGSGTAATEPEPAAGDELIDLKRGHLLPGLTDAHTHILSGVFEPHAIDGSAWRDRDEAIAAVRRAAAGAPEGTWIVAARFDHRVWTDPLRPTRQELDEVAGDHPVLLMHESIHEGVANSAALRETGVAWLPDGHEDIDRGKGGAPTGLIWERAFGRAFFTAWRVLRERMTSEGLDGVLVDAAQRILELGVVRIHEAFVPPDLAPHLQAAHERSPLRISWSASPSAGTYDPPQDPEVFAGAGYGEGVPHVKLFADGGFRFAASYPVSVAFRALASAVRSAVNVRGIGPLRLLADRRTSLKGTDVVNEELRYTDHGLTNVLARCGEAGVRPRVHSIGNLATVQTAQAAQAAGMTGRWSIEHIIGLRDAEMEVLVDADPVVSLQPRFLPDYADAITGPGLDAVLRIVPARTLRGAGLTVALSSDDPRGPHDPLSLLRIAVTRAAPGGRPLAESEGLSPEEAVAGMTSAGVAAAGLAETAGVVGVIEDGAPADLALVDGDPFGNGSRVVGTWVDGVRVAGG